jgi:hypothetical protein
MPNVEADNPQAQGRSFLFRAEIADYPASSPTFVLGRFGFAFFAGAVS